MDGKDSAAGFPELEQENNIPVRAVSSVIRTSSMVLSIPSPEHKR